MHTHRHTTKTFQDAREGLKEESYEHGHLFSSTDICAKNSFLWILKSIKQYILTPQGDVSP